MSNAASNQLSRVLGLAFGLAAVIGGTIGQGILRAPGQVAQGVPDARLILLLWIAGGAAAAIDAMSTVELAASIRETGGPYAFTRRAFGDLVGLAVGTTDWLSNMASIAFVSVVMGEYLHRLGVLTAVSIGALAAALPIAIGGVQWFGTRVSESSQELGSAVKTLMFGALVFALILAPHGAPVATPIAAPILTLSGLIFAARAVFNTYYGWNGAAYFLEEVADPVRAVVHATFGGIALVTLIYVLMNIAFLQVLSPAEMSKSTLVAADAAARVFGKQADTVITAISLISLITIVNTTIMQFPRVVYAIARDSGTLPLLAGVAANGTPRAALFITVAASALLGTIGVYDLLLQYSVSLITATSAAVNLAAIVMRRREPALDRPWKMPLFPLPALVGLAINAALRVAFVFEEPAQSAKAFVTLIAVAGVLYAVIWRGGRREGASIAQN